MSMGKHELDEPAPVAAAPGEPPPQRRDHIWVLFFIAACALAEVFGSWLGIASVSGFPRYGPVTTGWVLFATTEGFWGYALWSWLAGAPGPRSRRFAMTSAIVMFVLSFAGQEAGHLVATGGRAAPWYVVAIVTPLPLIAVGLIAILIHLRQADREAAEAAWRKAKAAEEAAAIERAEADERAWLRRELAEITARTEAEVTALRETATGAQAEAEAARAEAGNLAGQVEALTRKLADARERQKAGSRGRSRPGSGSRGKAGSAAATGSGSGTATGPEGAAVPGAEAPPSDLDAEALVLWHVDKGASASEAGRLAGLSDSRGRQIVRELAKKAPQGVDPAGAAGGTEAAPENAG